VKNRFQAFAFKCNLYRYTAAADGSTPLMLAVVSGAVGLYKL
jgi:hypothetical protein